MFSGGFLGGWFVGLLPRANDVMGWGGRVRVWCGEMGEDGDNIANRQEQKRLWL